MPSIRHEGEKKIVIDSWAGHVEQQIREAQARGDFDNLPGTGKPLHLDDEDPFNPELSSAFRIAKNAGAAPLWVQLEKEIEDDTAALHAMLTRTAAYLGKQAAQLRAGAAESSEAAEFARAVQETRQAPGRRWWSLGRRPRTQRRAAAPMVPLPQSFRELEQERLRARAL